jgi:drug/metabolite transporter (DMT)-like permease
MVQNWLVLAIVAGVSSVFFNAANRQTLKNGEDSTVYAWIFELIRFIFFASLIPFNYFLLCSARTTTILILLGFSELAGVYLYMKMHSHTELSISSILSRLRVLLVPMFAFVFLGERLTTLQYIGIITIFTGCLVVVGMKNNRSTKGIWYALAFVIVNTFSTLLLKSASSVASTAIVSAAFSFPAAVLIPLIMKSPRKRITFSTSILFKPTLLAAALNIITMYALVTSYQLAPAGQINGVFQGVTTLSVVFGIIFLHEKDHKLLKIIGGVLTTIGIILLV